jgi:hypothetical protein
MIWRVATRSPADQNYLVRHPPIRCTLVECIPVRYVLIFEDGFVVLDAELGLAVMSGLAAAFIPLPRGRGRKVPKPKIPQHLLFALSF